MTQPPTDSGQQIDPDFEERHTLALAIFEQLDVNPRHVQLDSLTFTIGPDTGHLDQIRRDRTWMRSRPAVVRPAVEVHRIR